MAASWAGGRPSKRRVGRRCLEAPPGIMFAEPKASGVAFCANRTKLKRPRHRNLDGDTCRSSPDGIRLHYEMAAQGQYGCSTLGADLIASGAGWLPRAAREGQPLGPR